ncbi:NAD(P)/FAD-dependent oxidoreductase [Phaeobacter porticola]|uniref:FAD dependent oxidoreductase n=1 Tax=Phaeobacter porticola TaxID=1844006 RepID=A0A1L3IAE0_9RHOB|nr:FAD-binding oxidoreductase [Phaeobacter porticola]APG49097.1 FAD dependent oxidoreductase [Phaeobacter porticola]
MTSDLHHSLWHQTCREDFAPQALIGAETADLVIIGGGYTGCSAALRASELGADVCLLEANQFGAGGSGRNVGLVNAGLWLPPEEINAKLGNADGTRLSKLLASAPGVVFDLIKLHQIDCEPTHNGTLHCAHAPSGLQDLRNRHRQLAAIGAPVKLLSRDEAIARVGSNAVYGALFDPRAGTIQPLAYAVGLARAAHAQGARLHANSPATAVSRTADGWTVTTPQGAVHARHLIIATNAYPLPIAGYQAPRTIPVCYFQAATPPLPDDLAASILPQAEGCWDTALIMSSWRRDRTGRLVIGGMGALSHPASAVHTNWLRRKLAGMFPALANHPFQTEWVGKIAMTTEHVPKIIDLGQGFACFGYSGRGIGPGTIFGQRMAEALIGGDRSVLPVAVTAQHDLPLARLRGAYYETGATLVHFLADRSRRKQTTPDQ